MARGVSRRGPHLLPEREPSLRSSDRASTRYRRDLRKSTWYHYRKFFFYCIGLSVVVVWFFLLVLFQPSSISVEKHGKGARSPAMLFGNRGRGTEQRPPWFLPFSSLSVETRFGENKLGIERSKRGSNTGLRLPQLALIFGKNYKDAELVMLLTLAKGLTELGYHFTIFSVEEGENEYWREDIGYHVHYLDPKKSTFIDWSNFEGVIIDSLEAKQVLSSLAQEPFLSTPLIWIIREDNLGQRLKEYKEKSFENLITQWQDSFRRADIIVFSDFAFAMLYGPLGLENFVVIPGSPSNTIKSEKYIESHSRISVRSNYGFKEGDLVILVLTSYFVYDEIPWGYVATIEALAPQISKLSGRVRFVFLHGNSSEIQDSSFQELGKHKGLSDGSISQYTLNHDINELIFLSDIILYASFQEEYYFPPLLLRAMSFAVPIIAPNITRVAKHVTHGVNGFLFNPNGSGSLANTFSLVMGDYKVSDKAKNMGNKGKLLAKDMLAFDFVSSYAKLLESILNFPSNVMLPYPISQIQQRTWLWNLSAKKVTTNRNIQTSIVDKIEEIFVQNLSKSSENGTFSNGDLLIELDFDDVSQIEISEDIERLEMQELEERMEKDSTTWETVYHTSRKADKSSSLKSVLDEGVLERTGQPVCIYEISNSLGSFPFLHRGSFYRGISLSRSGRRAGTDDVDAASRLRVLEEEYYKDILGEFGAVLSVANRIDSIHKLPWIGFQSWRASSREVSLSKNAEEQLEKILTLGNNGDAMYFWACNTDSNLDFWSMCDRLNSGHCRSLFGDAFRDMYGLHEDTSLPFRDMYGLDTSSLPPMPRDPRCWSVLHSWIMPTPSFLEFIIFSRMFLDSLDHVSYNASNPSACSLGSSKLEKKQCYSRVLEILVNVWAYHSGRRMFYIDPKLGDLIEKNPLEERRGVIWSKYFEFDLLKSMDEDFAEEADDWMNERENSRRRGLWGLTGEVHWQGVYDREREERYVRKMDKKRKTKEKLLDRHKFGYKQKPIE